MNCKMLMFAVTAGVIFSAASPALATPIYGEDFDGSFDIADASITDVVGFASTARFDYQPGAHTSDLLEIFASGGSSPASVTLDMSLGGTYDFYSGGLGEVSLMVRRFAGASTVTVNILEGATVVGTSGSYAFDDFEWFEVPVAVTADADAADGIQFVVTRNSGTSSTIVWFDDIAATAVPEPSSLGLAGIGGLLMLRRRPSVGR